MTARVSATVSVAVRGIGVLGAGIDGWEGSKRILAGASPYVEAPVRNPAPAIMPAAERRRASVAIRLALEVAHQAVTHALADPATTRTVFTSCDGDGDTIHAVCQAITQPDYPVSPTRFTNSVHNAPAGYWSIAVGARVGSTSLCAWEQSFAAGLVEAATLVAAEGEPVLLVASDVPLPAPLAALHHTGQAFGCAMLLAPDADGPRVGRLTLSLAKAAPTVLPAHLPATLGANPSAQSLPLLAALAAGSPARVVLACEADLAVAIEVAP